MPIAVTCGSCRAPLKAPDKAAGRRVKCPRCAAPLDVPAADLDDLEPLPPDPAPEATTPPPGPVRRKASRSADQGLGRMADHQVPEDYQDDFREELRDGEQLLWFARPRVDILLHRAKVFRLVGLLVGIGLGTLLPGIGVVLLVVKGAITPVVVYTGISVLFAVLLFGLAVVAAGAPGRVLRTAGDRACFALTDRRLLVHMGKGGGAIGRLAAVAAKFGSTISGKKIRTQGLVSYTGDQLTAVQRAETKKFPGSGDLFYGRTMMDEPGGVLLWAVDDLRGVEKQIREALIDPFVDRLLRGESPAVEDAPAAADADADAEPEALPPDTNIKDFVSGRATPTDPDDPNTKAAPAGPEPAPGKVPAALREEVEEELTAGEKLLWAGRPERGPQGRGLLGAVTGAATRKEPEYTLFALTNRRVLLWARKGSRVAGEAGWSWEGRGPQSYYPPALRTVGLEADSRIPNGGSIVFRRVRVKIVTETRQGGRVHTRGGKHHARHLQRSRGSSTKVSYEMHSFGILHVRDYRAVARLLYATLVAPVRGR